MTKKQVLELKEGDLVWIVTPQDTVKEVGFVRSFNHGRYVNASGVHNLHHTDLYLTKNDAIKSMIDDRRSQVTQMTDEREDLLKRIEKEEAEIQQLQQALKGETE